MKVGRLKRLLEGIDDEVEITLEIGTFEDQIVSVPLIGIRDDVTGEIILIGYEKGVS